MRNLFCILIVIFCIVKHACAFEVEHEISPKLIVEGQQFEITFRIRNITDKALDVRFRPSPKLEVIERLKNSVSVNGQVVNGKIVTRRDVVVKFLMIPSGVGQTFISDIKIVDGTKVLDYPTVNIDVLKELPRLQNIFVQAEIEKDSVYKGEGVRVDYYLYNSVHISLYDIKKFPKFNKFLKKNINVDNVPSQTVNLAGTVYRKGIKYSAILYPEVAKKITIDSLGIAVRYRDLVGASMYSGHREKSTDVSSRPLEIDVKELPSEGMPSDFTGLVGDFKFSVDVPKRKTIVGEPVDIKLSVAGSGLLDNYEPPVLYSDKQLESFDNESETREIENGKGERVFTQTFMARGPFAIQDRIITQSFFNPNTNQYETQKIEIPGISAIGTGSVENKNEDTSPIVNVTPIVAAAMQIVVPPREEKLNLLGPVFERWNNVGGSLVTTLQVSLLFVFIMLLFFLLKKKGYSKEVSKEVANLCQILKKDGFNYPVLYKLIFCVKESESHTSPEMVINSISLTDDAKLYFMELLKKSENSEYGIGHTAYSNNFKYRSKYFNELIAHTE